MAKKWPTIRELTALCVAVKKEISDEYRAFEDDDSPGIQLTVGSDGKGGWTYQTGDNSYAGGAYHYPYWGVVGIYRDTKAKEAAKDLLDQMQEAAS